MTKLLDYDDLPDICCGTCKYWSGDQKCFWMLRDSWGDDEGVPFWVKETEHKTKQLDGQDCKGWYS